MNTISQVTKLDRLSKDQMKERIEELEEISPKDRDVSQKWDLEYLYQKLRNLQTAETQTSSIDLSL